jgi:hypothetical protein
VSTRLSVGCILCGAEHEFTVTPGERRTHDSPGSGPEVDWRRSLCDCANHPAVDELTYWEHMDEAALAEAHSFWSEHLPRRTHR